MGHRKNSTVKEKKHLGFVSLKQTRTRYLDSYRALKQTPLHLVKYFAKTCVSKSDAIGERVLVRSKFRFIYQCNVCSAVFLLSMLLFVRLSVNKKKSKSEESD